jgi:hypothetical protein
LAAKPTFKTFKIFSEDLTAVHLTQQEVLLNKPTYIGFTVLDISKLIMYEFYYDRLKEKYSDNLQLLFTDTDSLLVSIRTDDFYKDMIEDQDWYDTSDYDKNHPTYSDKNKKVLGKFKDETNGNPIKEFVGLRAKMYSILEKDDVEKKKTAKGITKSTIRKLTHQQYLDALFNEISNVLSMQQIRSENHTLMTVNVRKTGLSPYDDKRYVLQDKINTLAHGCYMYMFDEEF